MKCWYFLQYTESLIVEHGYTRGEVNATTFHLQVLLTSLASFNLIVAGVSGQEEGAGVSIVQLAAKYEASSSVSFFFSKKVHLY